MYPFLSVSLEPAVVVLGLMLLIVEMFWTRLDKRALAWAGIMGLATVFVLSFFVTAPTVAAGSTGASAYTVFYRSDKLALFFKRFELVTTILVLAMAVDYLPIVRKFTPGASAQGGLGEFLTLPILTCAGLMWMASAVDFVMIFVSLELVTISFYVLVSYTRRNAASLEAGVKYLILGALSTGFLVYGITWIFGLTGETNLDRVGAVLANYQGSLVPVLFSFMLITIGLGFKIAAVPFQIWVPDVYQGAPTPVTAFLSVGSKAAGFVVFIRVLEVFFGQPQIAHKVGVVLLVMAAATLIYGNLAALPQNNLKRLLAYSSIAHAGYLLIAVASAAEPLSAPGVAATDPVLMPGGAIAFYLAGYLMMTLLAFMVMVVVANSSPGDDISDFNGLSKRSPFLAFAMLISMLSLAGLPFTVGFFGKFFIFSVAFAHHEYFLATVGVVTVACGFYYYLKVIRAMYFQPAATSAEATRPIRLTPLTRSLIAVLILSILWFGVNPEPVIEMLRADRPASPVAELRP